MIKCILEKSIFLQALSYQNSVVEKRNAVPILSNVLFLIDSSQESPIEMRGMGMGGMLLTQRVKGEIQDGTSGQFTLPVHTVYEIVRQLPDLPIELSFVQEGQTSSVSLRCGTHAQYSLLSLSPEMFPPMPQWHLPFSMKIGAQNLRSALMGTRFAMSQEETKFNLNGIFMHIPGQKVFAEATEGGEKELYCVATDLHRLSLMRLWPETAVLDNPDTSEEAGGFKGFIMGRKTVFELCRLLEEEEEEVELQFSAQHLKVSLRETALYSPLVKGNYPDYSQAIPREEQMHIAVDVGDFAKALTRLEAMTREKNSCIQLDFQWSEGVIALGVQNQRSGSGKERVAFQFVVAPRTQMESFCIGFNPRYLLSICQQVRGRVLEILFQSPQAPALLKNPEDTNALYVVMPTRTSGV